MKSISKILIPEKPTVSEALEITIYLNILDVKIDDIEGVALKQGYRRQTKSHISVLSGRKIKEIMVNNPEESRETLAKEFESLIKNFDWSYHEEGIYRIEKTGLFTRGKEAEERKSYIRKVNMPDMKKFYTVLNKRYGVNLPCQYPHITLYTKGERKNPTWYGIAIRSDKEFNQLNPIKIS